MDDEIPRLEDQRPTARLREAMAHGSYDLVLDELARLDRFLARVMFIHQTCDAAAEHAALSANARRHTKPKE